MKKTTKLDNFTAMRNYFVEIGKEEFVEVLNHEIELLAKKSTSERKPTATQIANANLGEAILEAKADGQAYTITEMIKTFECCADLSTQKVSPVVNKLVEEGKLAKYSEKRRTLFVIVKGE